MGTKQKQAKLDNATSTWVVQCMHYVSLISFLLLRCMLFQKQGLDIKFVRTLLPSIIP